MRGKPTDGAVRLTPVTGHTRRFATFEDYNAERCRTGKPNANSTIQAAEMTGNLQPAGAASPSKRQTRRGNSWGPADTKRLRRFNLQAVSAASISLAILSGWILIVWFLFQK